MSQHDDSQFTELQAQVRSLPQIPPDPRFKERVRREFTGEVQYPATATPLRGIPRRRFAGVLAAGLAAAAVLAFFLLRPLPATTWSVTEANAAGYYTVDGIPYRAEQLKGLTLRAGTELTCCPMGSITLKIPGELVFQLGNATHVRLDRERQGWFGHRLVARVDAGSTFGTTGPKFSGMRLFTKETEVEVRGTTFAVISNPEFTCVCLLEGDLQVRPEGSPTPYRVNPTSQYFVYASREAPAEHQLPAEDTDRLRDLRAQGTN